MRYKTVENGEGMWVKFGKGEKQYSMYTKGHAEFKVEKGLFGIY